MPRPSKLDQLSISDIKKLLDSRLSKVAKIERRRDALAKRLAALDAKIASMGGSSIGGKVRGSRAHNDRSLPETIAHVLSNHGKPMKVAQIVQSALATGYKTTSDNFRAIVNQALIKGKGKLFIPTDRGFYQLKK